MLIRQCEEYLVPGTASNQAGWCPSSAVATRQALATLVLGRIESVFYSSPVPKDDGDRLMAARIAGITRRHARARALTGAEEAAALAELVEVAGGRVDLLAMEAGLTIGFHERDGETSVCWQIAQLCIKAGVDTALISSWIEEGRRRAAAVKRPPFAG